MKNTVVKKTLLAVITIFALAFALPAAPYAAEFKAEWQISETGLGWTGCPLYIKNGKDDTGQIVFAALKNGVKSADPLSGKILWDFQLDTVTTKNYSSPAAYDLNGDGFKDIVFGSMNRRLYCLDGKTGKQLWAFMTGGGIVSSPVIYDLNGDGAQEILFSALDARTYCLNAKGAVLWQYATDTANFIRSTPACGDLDGDGRAEALLGTLGGKLICLSGEKGELKWEKETDLKFWASPLIWDIDGDGSDELIIAGLGAASKSRIMCLKNGGRQTMWEKELPGSVLSSPSVDAEPGAAGARLYLGTDTGIVYSIKAASGEVQWEFKVKKHINSSIALFDADGDNVQDPVFVSGDGCLYLLNGATGRSMAVYKTNESMNCSPLIVPVKKGTKAIICFGNWDYNVYAVGWDQCGKISWPRFHGDGANTGNGKSIRKHLAEISAR